MIPLRSFRLQCWIQFWMPKSGCRSPHDHTGHTMNPTALSTNDHKRPTTETTTLVAFAVPHKICRELCKYWVLVLLRCSNDNDSCSAGGVSSGAHRGQCLSPVGSPFTGRFSWQLRSVVAHRGGRRCQDVYRGLNPWDEVSSHGGVLTPLKDRI